MKWSSTREKILECNRLLQKLGRKQFGDPDPQTESALAAIQDLDRLERMAEAVLTVQSWQQLLYSLTPLHSLNYPSELAEINPSPQKNRECPANVAFSSLRKPYERQHHPV